MKIALLNSLYAPFTRGGAEVMVQAITAECNRQGYDVFVITITNEEEGAEIIDGIRVHRIRPWNIFSYIEINQHPFVSRLLWHLIDIFNFSSAKKVRNILQQENPDVIMTHNLKGLGYLVPRLLKKLKIKHIHTVHDVQLVVPSGLFLRGEEYLLPLYALYVRLTKFLFKSPDVVISPSQWLLSFYIKRGFFPKSKKGVVPNPAIALTSASIQKVAHQGVTRFVYIGQIEKHKGIELLLNAFSCVLKTQHNIELWIVGAGKDLEKITSHSADMPTIKIFGYVPNEELRKRIFPHVDYVVVPSLCYENSPTVIYESFANTTPVIAADIGGIAELVQKNMTGYSFKAGDEQELEQTLIKAIHHAKSSKKMGDHARMEVERYAIDAYIATVLEL